MNTSEDYTSMFIWMRWKQMQLNQMALARALYLAKAYGGEKHFNNVVLAASIMRQKGLLPE